MKLLHKLKAVATGRIKPDWWRLSVANELHEISQDNGNYRNQTEYILEVKIAVKFFANSAELHEARLNAENLLSQTLFKDALMHIAHVRQAVYDHDAALALSALAFLEAEINE
jgi:ribosomal protein L16 Arg81 hydroxylase